MRFIGRKSIEPALFRCSRLRSCVVTRVSRCRQSQRMFFPSLSCSVNGRIGLDRTFVTSPPSISKQDESPTWITDATGTLSREQQQEISLIVRELFQKYGVEMSVLVEATIPSAKVSARERAVRVFNEWGIGSENRNNGILIYMVLDRRRVEIVTGVGLAHSFPDMQVQHALEQKVIPRIHDAGSGAGIVEAANICADVLWKRYRLDPGENWVFKDERVTGPSTDLSSIGSTYGSGHNHDRRSQGRSHGLRNVAIVGAFAAVALKLKERKDELERQEKTCQNCGHFPMNPVAPGERDESTMTECNRVEESIGSAKFNQYSCPSCGRRGELVRREVAGGFAKCDKCQCRSITSNSVIRTPPSPSLESVEVIHHECAICRNSSNTMRVIPPIVPSPDMHGSGVLPKRESRQNRGGGHGGGSSSGGGGGASF